MATDIKKFPVVLAKNNNEENAGFGHYYPRTNKPQTLDLRGLIERVAFDQSVYSRDIIEGVVQRLTSIMVEQLEAAQPIKWEGLGTFSPIVESKKHGCTKAQILAGKANADDLVKGIHIRFAPENKKHEAITSRKFADLCSFQFDGVLWPTVYGEGNDAVTMNTVLTLDEWKERTTAASENPSPTPTPTPSTGGDPTDGD